MKRIFLRLWLVAVGLFILAMVGSQLFFWLIMSDDETAYFKRLITGGHRMAAQRILESSDREQTLAELRGYFGFDVAVVARADVGRDVTAQLDAGDEPAWIIRDTDEYWYTSIGNTDGDTGELLRVGPHSAFPLPDLTPRLLLLCAGAILFAGTFWWILRPLHKSQRALTETAEQIAGGNLEARVPASDMNAAPGMAAAFNQMAEQVEQLIANQGEILQVASHELRTPIARLRLGIHLLAGADDDREARADALDADLEELDQLVEEMLAYARVSAERNRSVPEPLAVAEVARRVIARQAVLAPDIEISLAEDVADALSVTAVPRLFERVLENLVGNARRYARSAIVIDAQRAGSWLEVMVDDDGPGIPPDQRERVRLPFSKVGEKGGHGMGLAIVERIVTSHDGQISIGDAPLGGCRIQTRWPVTGA